MAWGHGGKKIEKRGKDVMAAENLLVSLHSFAENQQKLLPFTSVPLRHFFPVSLRSIFK